MKVITLNGVRCETAEDAIHAYRPASGGMPGYLRHRDFIVAASVSVNAPTAYSGRNVAAVVCWFVIWCERFGYPIKAEFIFDPDIVEQYLFDGVGTLADASRASRRSVLRKVGLAFTEDAPWAATPREVPRHGVAVPFTRGQVNIMLEVARNQPTKARVRSMLGVIYLGAGAGAKSDEMVRVRGTDVFDENGIVLVRFSGQRERTVPVRTSFAAPLLEMAKTRGDQYLLGRVNPDRRDPMGGYVGHFIVPEWCPPFRMSRLRNTWLVEVLNHEVLLPEVMAAAGFTSTHSFGDLFQYVKPRDLATSRLSLGTIR